MDQMRSLLELIPGQPVHHGMSEDQPRAVRNSERSALAAPLAWTLAAGPVLAPAARCRGIHGGVLTLEVNDAAAQARIEGVDGELRRALERMLGAGSVRHLRFVPAAEPSTDTP